MQTERLSGYFDVRKYEKKVERKDRKLLGDGENINFCTSFPINDVPAIFKAGNGLDEFVKKYASREEHRAAEAEGRQPVEDRVSVKFKIGSGCRWFDKYGHATTRPSNEELDGNHYDVQIDFKRRPKSPDDDKAPNGYWVNALMYRKQDANPFAGQAFEEGDSEPDEEAAPAPAPAPEREANTWGDNKLPF